MSRRLIAVLAAGGALAVGAGGAAVAASSHQKVDSPAATFQENLAKRLGVSPDELLSDSKQAAVDTVDQLQKSGKLDSARAAKLKQRIARSGRAPFARLGAVQRRAPALRAGFKALADQLGTGPADLRKELRGGKTPADLIAKAGKDPATVKKAVQDAARTALDKQVQAGHLDSAKADQRAAKIAEGLTGDKSLKGRRG
jgi:hypothetical protein